MPSLRHHIVLLAAALTFVAAAAGGGGEEERAAACDEASWPQEANLRPDRLTVLLSGYSERRLPLLRPIAASYASHPLVLAVVILWCNPSTPSSLLRRLHPFPPSISLHRTSSPSLNARFLPLRSVIRTAAVAVADDDLLPDAAAISFAFATWQQHQHHNQSSRLVGLFPRSHHLDLAQARWAYTAASASSTSSSSPLRYSIVLTKFMLLSPALLRRYSCSPDLAAARAVVDRERNCEDILMNFVAAEASGEGPVLVEAGSVRDWGDPRNDDDDADAMKGVGLSGQAGMAHWEKRGGCITEFHRLLGRMPLRYSYGKVVPAGGGSEQGLCSKHGRLVPCDDQRQ
ncbi:glycosyltransferase family protein 64 C3 [Brachypodium distachyon]|uniref:Glycosyl transferase 64 domain-containing protein n=1 Tax=Brachypodium distachyon TaxID=15368 RepID=I1I8L8_BRADI|nr:glycosyltransferase family protein 64 C3 [Brachypodium distachyon]KQJ98991.1 hypothetical protein BRADI_3g40395v3 [Brachypodium distachyon]|eukprot:XP_014756041.1 glycosyltransferase family protein 64 C3 [Brachypodium distachyon]